MEEVAALEDEASVFVEFAQAVLDGGRPLARRDEVQHVHGQAPAGLTHGRKVDAGQVEERDKDAVLSCDEGTGALERFGALDDLVEGVSGVVLQLQELLALGGGEGEHVGVKNAGLAGGGGRAIDAMQKRKREDELQFELNPTGIM